MRRNLGWSLALACVTTLASAQVGPTVTAPATDPDGDDDAADTGTGTLPAHARFERVGRPQHSLRRVCDLTVFHDALYAAHANSPLGSDGATISRYVPESSPPFSVAFDWNRPGEPIRGGGAGQGFLRVHAINGRLFVPDADPPYNGFGITDPGTEGFVYVSDPTGAFAPARGAHLRPPGPPDATSRAGAGVLPRAYHVLDVIRYRGMYLASTGSVPPRERAWVGPSPGALHMADATLSRWRYLVDYPRPYAAGVWRLGYMVRFRGRLYAGIQDYDGREPNDYVVAEPAAGATTLAQSDLRGVRVTTHGTALTLRWYVDRGRLYWIAYEPHDHLLTLRVTDDGDHWRTIALPPDAADVDDITRFRDGLVLLTSGGLYRLDGETATRIADAPTTTRNRRVEGPFDFNDVFCAAPLAVYRNALYAGGQRDGALYRLVE